MVGIKVCIYIFIYIYISHVLRLLRMGCIEGTRWNIFTFWLSYHKNSNFWQTFWQSFLTHFYGNIFSNVIEHLCSLEISQSLHSRWVADIYGFFPWRFLQSRKMLVGAKVIAIVHCWTLPFDIGIHSYTNVVMLYVILMCISYFMFLLMNYYLPFILYVF